ncbi:MAG: cupredoxin domain-containing protein [Ktedonobacterales bacterium]
MSTSSLRHTRTPLMLWASLCICVCLLLAACGETSSTGGTTTTSTATTGSTTTATTAGAATIAMATSTFSGTTNVTIKAGQAVTFTSDGTHNLVIGMQGTFSAKNGVPSELNSSSGLSFSPGDSKTVTFPTAGTYPITCTIHPMMQATVVVTS